MTTKIIPTDKNGNVYYGPTTYKEAVAQIEDVEGRTMEDMALMMEDAGYAKIASRIRNQSKPGFEKKEKRLMLVTIKISTEQHNRIKIAAAWRGMSRGDFLRQAALDETERSIEAYVQHHNEIAKVKTPQNSQES